MAISPPWRCRELLMIITMTQAHTFIKKGDIPIEKILLMMRFFSFQKSGRKRTKLSLSRKCFTTHTIPINCEITVAVAAPRIPQSKWKIKDDVTNHGYHGSQHSLFRISRGTHDIVQSDHRVSNRCSCKNNLHEIPGIGQCILAGTEEP